MIKNGSIFKEYFNEPKIILSFIITYVDIIVMNFIHNYKLIIYMIRKQRGKILLRKVNLQIFLT